MVIEKILKQLTPRRIEGELKMVMKIKLPNEIQRFVNGYRRIIDPMESGSLRTNDYFWKWIFKTTSMVTSPTHVNTLTIVR